MRSAELIPQDPILSFARSAIVKFPEEYWDNPERRSPEAIKLGLRMVVLEAIQTDGLIQRLAAEGEEYVVREWGIRHKTTAGDGVNTNKRITGDIDPGRIKSNTDTVVVMRDVLLDYYNEQPGVSAEPTQRQHLYEVKPFTPDNLVSIGTFYGLRVSWTNE